MIFLLNSLRGTFLSCPKTFIWENFHLENWSCSPVELGIIRVGAFLWLSTTHGLCYILKIRHFHQKLITQICICTKYHFLRWSFSWLIIILKLLSSCNFAWTESRNFSLLYLWTAKKLWMITEVYFHVKQCVVITKHFYNFQSVRKISVVPFVDLVLREFLNSCALWIIKLSWKSSDTQKF